MDSALARSSLQASTPACNIGNSAALLAGQSDRLSALADRHGMKTLIRPGISLSG